MRFNHPASKILGNIDKMDKIPLLGLFIWRTLLISLFLFCFVNVGLSEGGYADVFVCLVCQRCYCVFFFFSFLVAFFRHISFIYSFQHFRVTRLWCNQTS